MGLIDKIFPQKLKELYWHQKMSSPKIARVYKCDPKYIRFLLKKYKIRIRTKSEARRLLYNINIPKKDLEKLYLEKKMSSTEIAKKFKCSPGLVRNRLRKYKIPIRSIQKALPLSNKPKYPRHNFSGDLEEKTYLIGFRRGDLSAYQARSRTIAVSMGSTKPNQIRLFEILFSKYGHLWKGNIDERGAIFVYCGLDNTFKFIIDKKDLIESWISRNKKYFAAFLAGYTDAEGSFCLCKGDGVFEIRSTDQNIIWQIRDKLIDLEIFLRPPQIVRRKGETKNINGKRCNKDYWGIFIHRKDALLKLIELVNPYLKHADKRKGMEIVKNNVLERNKKYNRHQRSKWDKLYLKENINYVRTQSL